MKFDKDGFWINGAHYSNPKLTPIPNSGIIFNKVYLTDSELKRYPSTIHNIVCEYILKVMNEEYSMRAIGWLGFEIV